MPKSRILSVGYVTDANLSNYEPQKKYDLVSAKHHAVSPEPQLLESGIDIGLMTLHVSNAPERRKFLGLKADNVYEIMVAFSPVHLHSVSQIQGGVDTKEVLKAKYAKFFKIEKQHSAGGFTYKKMFVNLKPKGCLSLDVQLTEIDNNKVDPNALEVLLEDTSIGSVLDLSPVNPKDYIMLASNLVNRVQEVFGSDKAGNDPLWNDTLVIESNPSIPGSYKLRTGFYAIVEGESQTVFNEIAYFNNKLINKKDRSQYKGNYLVFSVGKALT